MKVNKVKKEKIKFITMLRTIQMNKYQVGGMKSVQYDRKNKNANLIYQHIIYFSSSYYYNGLDNHLWTTTILKFMVKEMSEINRTLLTTLSRCQSEGTRTR